jgi:uncharacterized protein YukE
MDSTEIKGSTPEGLRNYARELGSFCQRLKDEMRDFYNAHLKMHDYWQGDQYDQFTEEYRTLCQKINSEITELDGLRIYLLKKADELETARKIQL